LVSAVTVGGEAYIAPLAFFFTYFLAHYREVNMRTTVVMFDLEGTIVDSWNSGCPLHKKIAFMNTFINDLEEKSPLNSIKFGIFSFAVDHEHEKKHGIHLASFMHREIDPKFVTSWKELEDLCKFRVDNLQKWELVDLFAKEGMFPMWCNQFPDLNFILFDDSLKFKKTVLKRDGQTIIMIKV
jgi:hypothetical protein